MRPPDFSYTNSRSLNPPPPASAVLDMSKMDDNDSVFNPILSVPTAKAYLDPRENAPDTYLYRRPDIRPTISELVKKSNNAKIKPPPSVIHERPYGTLYGVYLPLITSVCSGIFWSRTGKITSSLGFIAIIAVYAFCALLSFITSRIMSTLASNGEVRQGGAYFIISRTVGPSIGRGLGVLLFLIYCFDFSITIHIIGEGVASIYHPRIMTGSYYVDTRLIALIFIPIAFLGTFHVQIARIVSSVLCLAGLGNFLLGVMTNGPNPSLGFLKPSVLKFTQNLNVEGFSFSKAASAVSVVTAAMGSLTPSYAFTDKIRRPEKMLPNGMLYGIITSFSLFCFVSVLLAFCSDFVVLNKSLYSPLISFSLWPPIGYASLISLAVCKASSSLKAVIECASSMAEDCLIPAIKWKYHYIITVFVDIVILMAGNVEINCMLLSVCFMVLYAVLHFSAYIATTSHNPGWRPNLPCSKYVCLIGLFLCLLSGLMISPIVTVVLLCLVYLFSLFPCDQNWGSVYQSRALFKAYKNTISLMQAHKKTSFFNMSLMIVVSGTTGIDEALLSFVKNLINKNSFCVVSRILSEMHNLKEAIEERKRIEKAVAQGYHMLYETVLASGIREGLLKQMKKTDLGEITPNTICVDLEDKDPDDLYSMIRDAISHKWNSIVLRRPGHIAKVKGPVYVWWLTEDGGLPLLISSILSSGDRELRAISIAQIDNNDTAEEAEERMKLILEEYRIEATVIPIAVSTSRLVISRETEADWISCNGSDMHDEVIKRFLMLADLIKLHSSDASVVVVTLPYPDENLDSYLYTDILMTLSALPVTFCFVRGNGERALSDEI